MIQPTSNEADAPSIRHRMTVSYEGSSWAGWQSQPNQRGVQDRLEMAVARIVGSSVSVQGSGRTDAGVHALAQVAHVDIPATRVLPPEAWVRALNANLPASIRVLDCQSVAKDFHSRYSAQGKVYRYRIARAYVLSPFDAGRAWHVYGALDLELLRDCAQRLQGTHNFARLAANRGDLKEKLRRDDPLATTRTIHRVTVEDAPQSQELCLEFEGDGFLYKMVRLLVGSMVRVAQGRETIEWFADLLANPGGAKSHHCAPPDGLYLIRVIY
jgi:tRNA pseudouridine38-40 synthase